MHKVREAMKSSENHPMEGDVEVDEFVVGGKEESKVGRSYNVKKKKAVCAVEYTKDFKIKKMYIKQIDNYSSKELKTIFTKHISTDTSVTTDKWRGYAPLKGEFKITQEKSNSGLNFKKLHTMIHQVKSWIKTTYSWVSKDHIDRYFNEFCYRLNRSQWKNTIFNNLIKRMISEDKLYHRNLICS